MDEVVRKVSWLRLRAAATQPLVLVYLTILGLASLAFPQASLFVAVLVALAPITSGAAAIAGDDEFLVTRGVPRSRLVRAALTRDAWVVTTVSAVSVLAGPILHLLARPWEEQLAAGDLTVKALLHVGTSLILLGTLRAVAASLAGSSVRRWVWIPLCLFPQLLVSDRWPVLAVLRDVPRIVAALTSTQRLLFAWGLITSGLAALALAHRVSLRMIERPPSTPTGRPRTPPARSGARDGPQAHRSPFHHHRWWGAARLLLAAATSSRQLTGAAAGLVPAAFMILMSGSPSAFVERVVPILVPLSGLSAAIACIGMTTTRWPDADAKAARDAWEFLRTRPLAWTDLAGGWLATLVVIATLASGFSSGIVALTRMLTGGVVHAPALATRGAMLAWVAVAIGMSLFPIRAGTAAGTDLRDLLAPSTLGLIVVVCSLAGLSAWLAFQDSEDLILLASSHPQGVLAGATVAGLAPTLLAWSRSRRFEILP